MKKVPVLGVLLLLGVAGLALAPLPFSPTVIRGSVTIARAPADVYNYVTTAGNWPRWHPSSLAVTGATDHPMLLGEQVIEDFLVAGKQGKVRWTVVRREAPTRWVIAGQILDSGGVGKISYRLTAVSGGTLFEREFEYARPNLLFVLADTLRIKGQVMAESAEAVRHLKAMLEGPAPAPRVAAGVSRGAAGG